MKTERVIPLYRWSFGPTFRNLKIVNVARIPCHLYVMKTAKTKKAALRLPFSVVGMTGFEPATPSTPCWYATRLRYIPSGANIISSVDFFGRHFPLFAASPRPRGGVASRAGASVGRPFASATASRVCSGLFAAIGAAVYVTLSASFGG